MRMANVLVFSVVAIVEGGQWTAFVAPFLVLALQAVCIKSIERFRVFG